MLDLGDIVVRFGGVLALDGVRLTVGEGEMVGLVGPNGAGKTTLFNVIAGTVKPARGMIRFAGKDISRTAPHARARLGIGRTFQIPQPMHSLTVAQNLRVAQRFGGGGVDQRAAYDILKLVGLADRADRDAATGLSLTELKALELAKALAIRPRLLLLDEMLAGLEAHGKMRFAALLAEVHARYRLSTLVIEHDIETISTLCPRVAVLDFGRLIADGAPGAVFSDPAVVASYTGAQADA
jgi:branched-chain amino acid transport system ATP-binding protein